MAVAEQAIKRVQDLCNDAFKKGYESGFARGFEQGVATMCGEAPSLRILS